MKKKGLKETKAASKNSKSKADGPGRGGARKGAGAPLKYEAAKSIRLAIPAEIEQAMSEADIKKKTAFFLSTAAAELSKLNIKAATKKKILKYITH